MGMVVNGVLTLKAENIAAKFKEDLQKLCKTIDQDSARKVKDQTIDTYKTKVPKSITLLDEAFDDITAVLILPLKYRK